MSGTTRGAGPRVPASSAPRGTALAALVLAAAVSTLRHGPRRPRPRTRPAGTGVPATGEPVGRPTSATATRGKVLLVSTQGGHLAQLLALQSWYSEHDRVWVCPDTPDVADRLAEERVIHSYTPTTRNVPNLLRNLVLAVQVMRRERPSVVVSAGAGVAVPFFVIAWAMRVPTAFIEVFDRIDSPTMTGRLCGPFSTRRIVQWKSQQEFYPESQLVGPLL